MSSRAAAGAAQAKGGESFMLGAARLSFRLGETKNTRIITPAGRRGKMNFPRAAVA